MKRKGKYFLSINNVEHTWLIIIENIFPVLETLQPLFIIMNCRAISSVKKNQVYVSSQDVNIDHTCTILKTRL